MEVKYTYADCVKKSEQVSWRLDDVMPADARLNFDLDFLPQALAPTRLEFLSTREQRSLNQIAGNAYLNLFHFVEEYILATMMKHCQAELFGNSSALRALTRFVDEELKHQQMFERFREAFARDFGHPCAVLDNAAEVAGLIMSKSPLGVLFTTLHVEWMTQEHFTACIRDARAVDPFFKSLLHHHWLEECQHARIDTLEAIKLASGLNRDQREAAADEYIEILGALDGLLVRQAEFDVESLQAAAGRVLPENEADRVLNSQHRGYRKTFLWYGMTHRNVQEILTEMAPRALEVVQARAADISSDTGPKQ